MNKHDKITDKQYEIYQRIIQMAFAVNDIEIDEDQYKNPIFADKIDTIFSEIEKIVIESESKIKSYCEK